MWKGADQDSSDLAGTSDDEEWQRGHCKESNDQASRLAAKCFIQTSVLLISSKA